MLSSSASVRKSSTTRVCAVREGLAAGEARLPGMAWVDAAAADGMAVVDGGDM